MVGQCCASRKVPSRRRKSRVLSLDIRRACFDATAIAVTAKDDGTTEFAIAITADEAAVGVCFAWPVIKDTRLAFRQLGPYRPRPGSRREESFVHCVLSSPAASLRSSVALAITCRLFSRTIARRLTRSPLVRIVSAFSDTARRANGRSLMNG